MTLPARELVDGLRSTLLEQGVAVDDVIASFEQVRAAEERSAGRRFSLRDHVSGLVFSLLSSQRAWGPIQAARTRIIDIFSGFDPEALLAADPRELTSSLQAIRCGNRQIQKQMEALTGNIEMLSRIDRQPGGLELFVVSARPELVADALSRTDSPKKLKMVGGALAMEYLRNVGVDAAKPDVHVLRVLGRHRLAYHSAASFSPAEAVRLVERLAGEAGCGVSYLDNLLWMHAAKDYGDVCGARPRCGVCALATGCRQDAVAPMQRGVKGARGADPSTALVNRVSPGKACSR